MSNNPEQEAEQLINNFYIWGIKKEGQSLSRFECRQLALIAVDRILIIMKEEYLSGSEKISYWEKTKEIIQLK